MPRAPIPVPLMVLLAPQEMWVSIDVLKASGFTELTEVDRPTFVKQGTTLVLKKQRGVAAFWFEEVL